MNSDRGRWLFILLAVSGVTALIAMLTWMLTATGGSPAAGGSGGVVATAVSTGTAGRHRPARAHIHPSGRGASAAIPATAPAGFGWGQSATPHHLVLEVATTQTVFAYMGWRVPTAVSSSGLASMTSTHWSRPFTVYGAPYYAKFYVQYGPNTGAVTCRILVDGKLRVQHTAYGRYGGVWCFG